jgi:(1->4)-alpha-D-glucan 1-alpha-D-glucosylmutase
LCKDWSISGTSGYDFLSAINDLFVDSANQAAMSEIYYTFIGDHTSYSDWVYRAKCRVLETAMYSEMESLTGRLDQLAQAQQSSRDFTRHQLRDALREIIACFPVYRSYVSPRGVSEFDIKVVNEALTEARHRNGKMDPRAMDFVRDCALLHYPGNPGVGEMQLDFVQRFQQLTSPVNAKGIEDCVFYNYNRLTSLNEVGGDAGRFGRDSETVHRYLADRHANWPLGLSPLSTHDTKRSEDVRARLNVLSEIPSEWGEKLQRWKQLNAHCCSQIHPNDQYLLYQTLIGAWPIEPMDEKGRESFAKRIVEYLIKATREAKERNSWVNPDQAYESAIKCVIDALLDPEPGNAFLEDFLPFQSRISRLGMLNALSQTALRLTAPGIADTYQGTELLDLSLVDPDNRRPVDFQSRSKLLTSLESSGLPRTMEDGRAKLWLTSRLLRCRKQNADLFLKASYRPIYANGERANSIFCFVRVYNHQTLLVLVPRLFASFTAEASSDSKRWGDTRIDLPASIKESFENVLTGQVLHAGAPISIAGLLGEFPVAVFIQNRN